MSLKQRKHHMNVDSNNNNEDDLLKASLFKHLTLISKGPLLNIPFDDNNDNSDNMFMVDPNIKFTTDVITGTDSFLYHEMAMQWSSYCTTELSECVFSVDQISYVQQNTINVKWNVTFIPESLLSIVKWTRLNPFWKISFFNVLDKERIQSTFSWKALITFMERALFKGEVRLPHAVIVGSTDFTFKPMYTTELLLSSEYNYVSANNSSSNLAISASDDNEKKKQNLSSAVEGNEFARSMQASSSTVATAVTTENSSSSSSTTQQQQQRIQMQPPKKWILQSSKESLNLVRSIDKGYLKNRKLATDLLEFLDALKPINLGLGEWNDVLTARISTKNIPGMRPLDIDGIDAEQQTEALEGLSKV